MVLVGDAHQLSPVKARGGMFEQLCADLPWTQRLGEVWRMRDPEERDASLALRDGGRQSVRSAVGWYRTHDRLHCGDPIAMAADALTPTIPTRAGKDALLICDTREMADALNRRLHDTTVDREAPSVTGARDQDRCGRHHHQPQQRPHHRRAPTQTGMRTATVDQFATATAGASPRSTPTPIALPPNALPTKPASSSTATTCASTSRLGYAATVHSAQGVTADTCHAILGENTTRAMLYVAMTRGRDTNTAYFYQRITGDNSCKT